MPRPHTHKIYHGYIDWFESGDVMEEDQSCSVDSFIVGRWNQKVLKKLASRFLYQSQAPSKENFVFKLGCFQPISSRSTKRVLDGFKVFFVSFLIQVDGNKRNDGGTNPSVLSSYPNPNTSTTYST